MPSWEKKRQNIEINNCIRGYAKHSRNLISIHKNIKNSETQLLEGT